MTRFLFATMPAAGHVIPALTVARELVERGHEVQWYTGAAYRGAIEAIGATITRSAPPTTSAGRASTRPSRSSRA